jgi:segregation and condensation protein A
MKSVNIKLEVFEGPIELLYNLIDKNKIDIYDIPIANITDQYIDYIKNFTSDNMESMSEFIVMAATLIEIKSKMLLPKPKEVKINEKDPREELIIKLVEYKKLKKTIESFKESQLMAEKFITKKPEEEVIKKFFINSDINVDEILHGVSIQNLSKAFKDVLYRKELKVDVIHHSFNEVKKEKFTIEDKIKYINNMLSINSNISFSQVFNNVIYKDEKITMFLALLQMLKNNDIIVIQESMFNEIFINKA